MTKRPKNSTRPRKAILFTDGASRGNPGPAACGFAIYDETGSTLEQQGIRLGNATNNIAEYQGVILGLEKCIELGVTAVTVKTDSQLLVRQLNGMYKVRAPHILPLFQKVESLAGKFDSAHFIHVPREENTVADALANRALDTQSYPQI